MLLETQGVGEVNAYWGRIQSEKIEIPAVKDIKNYIFVPQCPSDK